MRSPKSVGGHVAVAGHRAAAQLLDERDRFLGRRVVEIVDHDRRAVAREPQRDLLADAAARSGDDRDFAVELSSFNCSIVGPPGCRDRRGRRRPEYTRSARGTAGRGCRDDTIRGHAREERAMKDSRVRAGGGRKLACTEIGAPGGRGVFFFDGAPMSRLHLLPLEEQFAAQGLRVVSPDRPGYGRSSPQPGRSMAGLAGRRRRARRRARHRGGSWSRATRPAEPTPWSAPRGWPSASLGGAVMAGVTDMAWRAPGAGTWKAVTDLDVMRLRRRRARPSPGAPSTSARTEADFSRSRSTCRSRTSLSSRTNAPSRPSRRL